MLTDKEIQKLIKAGYCSSFNQTYYFKVKWTTPISARRYTAIFIHRASKAVEFEGVNEFRGELLEELKKLIGGIL